MVREYVPSAAEVRRYMSVANDVRKIYRLAPLKGSLKAERKGF